MPAQTSPSPPGDAWKQAESGQGPALEREGETRQRPHCSRPHTITTTACPPTPSTTTISAADRMMMGGERNQTRERELKLHPARRSVAFLACRPGMRASAPQTPVATNPWAFLGFRPRLTPWVRSEESRELSPSHAARGRKRESRQPGCGRARNFPHLPPRLYFYTRYCRLLPRSHLLPAPCSAFSSPVPPPPPRLASPALPFLRCGGVEEVSS